MPDLADRLREAAERIGGLNELSKKVGVPRRTLGNWLSGRTPKPDALRRIADAAGVSLEWLITGQGDTPPDSRPTFEKLLSDQPSEDADGLKAFERFAEKIIELKEREFALRMSEYNASVKNKSGLINSFDPDADENDEGYSHETWKPRIPGARPEIDARLGAGEGSVGQMLTIGSNGGTSGHRVVAEWLLPEAFLVGVMEANPSRTIVMEVVGDSMQPTYQPGDRVLIDLAQTILVADTVYAISDGYSEPQIKRLQRVPFSQPARVRIISDNPALQTDEVELERVHIIGRICGVMARR